MTYWYQRLAVLLVALCATVLPLSATSPVTVSPLAMNFGQHTVGIGSSGWVSLTNHLTTPLTIMGITVSGDFSQTNNCPASLRAGLSCNINVTFTPTQLGTRTGTLYISDSSGLESVSLSGTGSLVGLTSILVTPSLPKVAAGRGQQFTATGRFTNGTSSIITGAVTWASTNTGVATISNADGSRGLAITAALGTSSISAAVGSIKGGVTLTVTAPVLSSVLISPANPSTPLGLPTQFSVTGYYSDNSSAPITSGVTWTSTPVSVATIDQHGLATLKAVGSSTIKATVGSMSAQTTLTVLAPALLSLTLTPAHSSIGQGSSQQFTATGTYTDHSSRPVTSGVTWSSSNQSIPVNQQGVVTGSGTGTSTITASVNTVSGSTTLTVFPVLQGITITPNHVIVPAGLTQQFTATGSYSDHSTQVLNSGVTWSSSSPANVSINSQGFATAVTSQTNALITAAVGAIHGLTDMFVDVPELVSVTVTPQDPYLFTGATQQLQAIGLYSDHSNQTITSPNMFWTSSDGSLATVTSYGFVIALATGAPTITARVPYIGNGNGQCCLTGSTTVHIVPAASQSLAMSPSHPAVAPGTVVPLSALKINNDGSKTPVANPVTWSSSAPAVASVGPDGTLTALSPGVATVSVQCPDLGLAGSMPVEVYETNQGRFAYVLNSHDNSITMYLVDGTSGQLAAAEITPVGDGTASPASFVGDPSGRFLYLADLNGGLVRGYAVDANTGSLSLIPNAKVSGIMPLALAMHPSGKYLFAVGDSLNVYSIDTSGALTAGTKLPTQLAIALGFDPSGKFAYATNANNNGISGFQFDAITGALSAMPTTFVAGAYPAFVAVHPSGSFAYVSNGAGQSLSEFDIDPVTGALSAVGQPFSAGGSPGYMQFDTTGKYLYASMSPANIAGFSVDSATGNLAPLLLSPFATDQRPGTIAIDPTNQFLYVVNGGSNDVTSYSLGLDGGLTRVSSVYAGISPNSLVLLKGATRPQVIMSLILDRSGSMSVSGGATALPPAVVNFVNKFDDSIDQLAMVSFASNSTVDVSMRTGWKTAITNAINAMVFSGATFTAGGLSDGFAQINSAAANQQNTVKVAVFFTDGHANTMQQSLNCSSGATTFNFGGYDSPPYVGFFNPVSGALYCTATNGFPPCCGTTTYYSPSTGQQVSFLQPNVAADAHYEAVQEANQMRAAGITIYAIGLGSSVDQAFLQQVANDPNSSTFDSGQPVGQAVVAPQTSDLDAVFQAIALKVLGVSH